MGLAGKITPPACVWIILLYFNTNCETPLMIKALVTSWNNRKGASLALLHGKEQEFRWQGRMNFTLPHFCSYVCSLLPWHKKGETCQGSCLQTQGQRRLRGCFADRVSLPPKASRHTDIRSEWVGKCFMCSAESWPERQLFLLLLPQTCFSTLADLRENFLSGHG